MTGPTRPPGRPSGAETPGWLGARFAWDGVGAGSPRGRCLECQCLGSRGRFFISGIPRTADPQPQLHQPAPARGSVWEAWAGAEAVQPLPAGPPGLEGRAVWAEICSLGGGLWLRFWGQGGLCHFKDSCLQFCIQGRTALPVPVSLSLPARLGGREPGGVCGAQGRWWCPSAGCWWGWASPLPPGISGAPGGHCRSVPGTAPPLQLRCSHFSSWDTLTPIFPQPRGCPGPCSPQPQA